MAGLRKFPTPNVWIDEAEWDDLIDYLGGETTNTQIIAAKMLTQVGGVPLSDLLDANKLKISQLSTYPISSADLAAWPSQAEVDRILAAATWSSDWLAAFPSQAETDRILAGYEAPPKDHSAAKITAGILAAARGGFGKTVDLTDLADKDLLQYISASDKFARISELTLRNAQMLQGVDVHDAAPSDGQYLKYVAANKRWEPASM